jgi:hypothetical protein
MSNVRRVTKALDLIDSQTDRPEIVADPGIAGLAMAELMTSHTVQTPLPAYVNNLDGVDDIGRTTSQAIVVQFEQAAKTVEAMGAEMIQCVREIETLADRAKTVIEFVEQTAQAYRDEAKAVFERIQKASLLVNEVQTTCETMQAKIRNGDAP